MEEETPTSEIVFRALKGLRKRFYFPIVFLVLCLAGTLIAMKVVEPRYSSRAMVRIEKRSPLQDESRLTKNDPGYLEGEVMWFTYRPVIEEMIDRVGLASALVSREERQKLIKEFQEERIQVEPFKGASTIEVRAFWNNPRQAREIVSTLTEVFIERYETYNQTELERRTSFLARQVEDLKARIEEKEASLSEFQKTAKLLSTDDGLKSINESVTTLEVELGKAEFELDAIIYQKKQIQSQIENLGKSSPVSPALVNHLVTPTSPLYDKLQKAEALERSIALLEQQEQDEADGVGDGLQDTFGQPSPVNEAVRKSLVQDSPLRSQLMEVIQLEKQLKNLHLQYKDKHTTVILAKDQLRDASESARSMLEALDPGAVKYFDEWGASVLLAQAETWAPGLGVETQKLPKYKERLEELSGEIRQLIGQIDPDGVEVYESFGAGYLLSQAINWQGQGVDTSIRLEDLTAQLRELEFTEKELRDRIAKLEESIEDTELQMDELPSNQAILDGKERELRVLENLYVVLQQRLSTATIEARANMWQVEVVDPPVMASDPDFPKPKKFLAMGGLMGLLLGIGLPLLIEFMDNRIQSPQDIEKKSGLPVLAKLPELGFDSNGSKGLRRLTLKLTGDNGRTLKHRSNGHKKTPPLGSRLLEAGQITEEQLGEACEAQMGSHEFLGQTLTRLGFISEEDLRPFLKENPVAYHHFAELDVNHLDSPYLADFHRLQSQIKFTLFSDTPLKSILITSASPLEGKTVCACYLSITTAVALGKKVLLLDTDFRNPSLHKVFHLDNTFGLSDILVNSQPASDALRDTSVPNLKIITSGTFPSNPSHLLSSVQMDNLLKHFHEEFDLVFMDGSPVLPTPDSAFLGMTAHGTILIADAKATKMKDLEKAINKLDRVNAKLLGVILNRFDETEVKHYQYYYPKSR